MDSLPSRPTCPLSRLLFLCVGFQQQQLQAQHLSHAAHGPPVQLPPHPSGLQPPGLPPVTGAGSGLLALGALGSQAHLPVKDEKNHHDLEHRGEEHNPTGVTGNLYIIIIIVYSVDDRWEENYDQNSTITRYCHYYFIHEDWSC